MPKHLSDEMRLKIAEATKREPRPSFMSVAKELGLPHQTVWRWYNKAINKQPITLHDTIYRRVFLEGIRLWACPPSQLFRGSRSIRRLIDPQAPQILKFPPSVDQEMERNKLDAATIKGLKRYMALSGVRANIRRCWEKGSFAVHCVPIQWRQRTTKDNYAKKSSHGAMIRGSLLLIADRGYRHPFGRHFPRLKVRLAVIPGSEYLPAVAERIVVNFATSPENSVRTLHLVAAGSGPTSRIDLASLQSRLPKDVQVVVDHATKGGGPFTLPFSFPSPQAVENLLAIYWSNAKDLSKTDSAKSEALMNCGDIERAKVQFPHVEQLLLR